MCRFFVDSYGVHATRFVFVDTFFVDAHGVLATSLSLLTPEGVHHATRFVFVDTFFVDVYGPCDTSVFVDP